MSAVRLRHRPPGDARTRLPGLVRHACKSGRLARSVTSACHRGMEKRRAWSVSLRTRRLRAGGSDLVASDRFLQFLGRAERDFLAGLDLDRFAGCGVASHACGTLAHLQDAKSADANALAFLQVLDDVADEIAEYGFGLLLRHFVGFRERRGEMFQR